MLDRLRPRDLRLFLLVFLTLYLELALIRFASSEVHYLAYFSNLILISAFLGIGLGFLSRDRQTDLFSYLPQALLFLIAFILLARLDLSGLRLQSGVVYYGASMHAPKLPLWICLPVLFATSSFIFAAIAQETGRLFSFYKPIVAYSIDIGGSLAGVLAFTLHSRLGSAPLEWFAVVVGLLTLLGRRAWRFNAVALGLAALLLVASNTSTSYTAWSPYQKLELKGSGIILANGVPFQEMGMVSKNKNVYTMTYTEAARLRGARPINNALIIGAGSGMDAAYALANGVTSIDAVEIDPDILKIGQRLNPARPYDDPRVTPHVADGRAFMESAQHKKYDLVIYALTDSLALLSRFASVRLESYLFTVESFRRARRLLSEDGVLVLYNSYQERWVRDRIARMLQEAFGHPPVVTALTGQDTNTLGLAPLGYLTHFVIGPKVRGPALPRDTAAVEHATDDWPFLYVRDRQIPAPYLLIMLMFLLCGAVGVRLSGGRRLSGLGRNGPFFLMGAAFLLLETKSIAQFALLFGTTWLVNSLVFFAILLSVLLANWMVVALRIQRRGMLYSLLFLTLLVNALVPAPAYLAISSPALRYVLASAVVFSPIFTANLVFGYLFKDTKQPAGSFGWNIMGALVGGTLEYVSLVTGYRALTFIVAALYGGAVVWAARLSRGR